MENQEIKKTNFKQNKKTLNFYCIFIEIILFALIAVEVFLGGSYLDEIVGLLSMFYLIFIRRNLQRIDAITLIILFITVGIGIASNLVSGLNTNWFSVLVDFNSETKLLFTFLAVKYILNNKEKQRIINSLTPFAKLYTLAAFFCSIISLFKDIGMSGNERYGIRSFKFIFNLEMQYIAVYMLVFAVLIFSNKISYTNKLFYCAIAICSMLLSTKSPAIIFTIIFIGLTFYFKKHAKLNIWVILIGIAIIAIAGRYQIESYILKEGVARRLFIQYSFKTANNYFPLGSGFATYGSAEAAVHYSPLYYLYGFNKVAGLTPDKPSFSSDTFWAMALGQFGWIGGMLYFSVYILTFISMAKAKMPASKKAFIYAIYIQHLINGLGTAVLSSASGMIAFIGIALVSELYESKTTGKRLHIHI